MSWLVAFVLAAAVCFGVFALLKLVVDLDQSWWSGIISAVVIGAIIAAIQGRRSTSESS